MKKYRKLLALVLAMLMTFQPAMSAFAAEPAAEVLEEIAENAAGEAETAENAENAAPTEKAEESAPEEASSEEAEKTAEEAVKEESVSQVAEEASVEESAEETVSEEDASEEAAPEEDAPAEEPSGEAQTEAPEETGEAADPAAEEEASSEQEETSAVQEETSAAKESAPAEKEEAEDILLTAEAEDGMQVILTAKAGTFKYAEDLELQASVVREEAAEEASEDLETKTKNDNIAKRVTYDIKVMHGDEELEPLDGKKVRVSFTLPDVPSGADAVSVYHHEESGAIETIVDEAEVEGGEEAEVGNIEEADEAEEALTVEGDTDGFSYYTVDFTYEEKELSIPGDTEGTPLAEILAGIGIEGSIERAVACQDAACTVPAEGGEVKADGKVLFSVYEIDGTWFVDAVNAFRTKHGLVVYMDDGAEYKIEVTDAMALMDVAYIGEDGTEQIREGLVNIADAETFIWDEDKNEGWYAVRGELTVNKGIEVLGNVKLILMDGSSLTVNGEDGMAAINVTGDNKLTVYVQSAGTGSLAATAGGGAAGIGGNYGESGNNISFYGGSITATGKDGGAGIGGGYNGAASDILLAGGVVTALAEKKTDGKMECGAGIGSGCYQDAENIMILDGSVRAEASEGAAAIGGGSWGAAKSILISGESTKVHAIANGSGAGIGGGSGSLASSELCIEGGYVEALSEEAKAIGAGTDGSYCEVFITTANEIYSSDDSTCVNADKSLDKTKMTRFIWNQGKDLSKDLTKHYVLTGKNTESKAVAVEAQTVMVTYGTPEAAEYTVTGTEINDKTVSINWYSDAEGTAPCEAPAGATLVTGSGFCRITNGAKTPAGTYYFKAVMEETFSDVASYTVGKRSATITSGSASKVYDGTPLTCEEVTVTGLAEGEDFIVTATGSVTGSDEQTKPTVADNTFSYIAADGTNLDNYKITEVLGKLTVVKQLFAVIGENYCEKYDGKDHSFSVKVIAANGEDVTGKATIIYATSTDGTSWSPSTTVPSITNAGKLYVKAQATCTVRGSTKTLASDVYTMEVLKREVVLTSGSDEKEYDGTDLTKHSYAIGGDGFAGTQGVAITYTGVQRKAGSSVNGFTYELNSGAEEKNYNITKIEGKLTVTPKSTPIIITTSNASKTYDGKTFTTEELTYTLNADDIICTGEGDALKVTFIQAGKKDAGTYVNRIEYQVINGVGEDVTGCYTFAEPVCGTLAIYRRDLTLSSGSDLKVKTQDGDYAYNGTVNDGGGLVTGEGLVYSNFPKVTTVSYTPTENTFDYAPADGSNFNARNYKIKCEYGQLMLVEEMSILGEDVSFTYDGTSHTAPVREIDNGKGAPVIITYATSADGETWSEYSTTVPSLKDAGVLFIKVKAKKKGVQEKDASYTLTVEPRNVTISSDSATKSYDGTALTKETYTISGEGFVSGEGVEKVKATGTQTDVGRSNNRFTYTLKANTKSENYNITEASGTLTVTRNVKSVVITTLDGKKVYDGTPLTNSNYAATWGGTSVSNNKLCENDVLEVLVNGSITDAGTAKNTCSCRVVRDGRDITDYYTIKVVGGDLTVSPRSVIITTASAEKKYDGTALKAAGYTIGGEGFIGNDGIETVKVAGSRTNAGTAANVLDSTDPYKFKYGTNINNYKVIVKPGTLTVTKRKVTVTSGSAVSTYDATPKAGLTNGADCTVTGDGFVAGEASPKGSTTLPKPTSEPSSPVSADNTISYGWTGNGNPANYEITEWLGTLQIVNNSASVAVATNYVGVYDGQPHKGSFTSTITDCKEIEYSTDGSSYSTTEPTYTDVISAQKVMVRITGQDGSIAECSYTVTINKRELTLTSGSAEKVYDGKELTCSEYTVGGDGFATVQEGKDANVQITGTITDWAKAGANNRITPLVDNGEFKTKNYNISLFYGKLTITKRPVTLTSGDLDVVYDGQAHKKESVESKGFISGQNIVPNSFAEATDAGTYLNTFRYDAAPGTTLDNYDVKVNYGTITINPRAVTMTSGSASKVYDGQPLTNSVVEVSSGSFLAGDEPTSYTTGSQKSVGSSYNTFDVDFTSAGKEINYNITKEEGTLTVTADESLKILVPEKTSFDYDGQPHGDAATAVIGAVPSEKAAVWYSIDDGKNWTDEVPQITEVGSVNVKVMAILTGYKRAEASYTLNVVQYRVLYIADDATSGSVPVDNNNYTYGTKAVLLDNVNGLARGGYTFVGWYLNSRYGTIYAPGFSLTVTGSMKLYAAWAEVEEPTPSFTGSQGSPATGTADNPVTNGQWNCGPGGQWTFRTNGQFKNTWGYIKLANGQVGWFWFDKNGIMATGWQQVNGKWYYFNEKHDGTYGMMLFNTTTPDGYKVGPDGTWIQE